MEKTDERFRREMFRFNFVQHAEKRIGRNDNRYLPPSSGSGDKVGWLPRRPAGGIDSSIAAC